MISRRWALATVAAIAFAGAAQGNDSVAETGAGGLVLQRTDAIDLVAEDLFLSADQVRVQYVFRNRTARDVDTLVAFPLPSRNLADAAERDIAFPAALRTNVDGGPVVARLERHAVGGGKDQTALLQRLRIPLAPDPARGTQPIIAALEHLAPAQKAELHKFGLIRGEPTSQNGVIVGVRLLPQWTVKDVWFWTQRFPAGRELRIDHAYRPGTGGSADTIFASPKLRATVEGQQQQDLYCVDPAFLAGVDRLRHRGDSGSGLSDRRIAYVLSSGANWRSPIARLRIVIDKGRPANLVSFCGGGVRKLGPTQFELDYRNYRPLRDVHVLIVEPH
jgi:hypothetical protein